MLIDIRELGRAARRALSLLAATGAALAGPPASAETIALQGSTVFNARVIEPHRGEIEAIAGRQLKVIPNKSIHGLTALLEGRADIAMISSGLEGEARLVLNARPDLPVGRLRSFEIARTRVAFPVHPSNPVKALTLDQLARILLGEVGNWREVGGNDLAIMTVSTQPGGGVPTTVRSQLLGGRALAPSRLVEVEASRHVVKIVEQEAAALGLAQLGLVEGARVHELETGGAVEQQLNLVTLDAPGAAVLAVIEAARVVAARRLR